MKFRKPFSRLALIALTVSVGCNSVDVEDDPIDLFEDLATASSTVEARTAIARAFTVAGINGPSNPVFDSEVAISGRTFEGLSEAQAAYNLNEESRGKKTFRGVYEVVSKTDRVPSLGPDEASDVMWGAIESWLELYDDPDVLSESFHRSYLLLGATHGVEPSTANLQRVGIDDEISPFQAAMIGLWLYDQGPSLKLYRDAKEEAELARAAGKVLNDVVIPLCVDNSDTWDGGSKDHEYDLVEIWDDCMTLGSVWSNGEDKEAKESDQGKGRVPCSIGMCAASQGNQDCYSEFTMCAINDLGFPDKVQDDDNVCLPDLNTCLAIHPDPS